MSSKVHVNVALANSRKSPKRLIFCENIEYAALVRKVAALFGLGSERDATEWRLMLGGDHALEETTEIDDGDRLVLDCGSQPVPCDDESDSDTSFVEDVTDQYRPSIDTDSDVEDVTEQYRVAKEEAMRKMAEDAKSVDEDDDTESERESDSDMDSDCLFSGEESSSARPEKASKAKTAVKPTRRRRPRSKRKVEPSLEVIMEDKDIPAAPGTSEEDMDDSLEFSSGSILAASGKEKEVDEKIKQRVVKLLNTGFHEGSNEHEAQNAMKLARRLMERHNLSQAMLLRERDGAIRNEGSLKGGLVVVRIVHRKTQTNLSALARWTENLIRPVCQNFKVEAFKVVARRTARRSAECSVTFYGIYASAQLAGYAFKIATERIAAMAAEYECKESIFERCANPGSRAAATKTARLSYALGIVQGLAKDVEETQRREEERRKQKLERARCAASTVEAYEESDDSAYENDGVGSIFADKNPGSPIERDRSSAANEASNQFGSDSTEIAESPSALSHRGDHSATDCLDQLEREETAALALCDHRACIAEDVLKENKIKVRKSSKRRAINFDRNAYDRGMEDAKEIDLNQRAIRDSAKQVKEELKKRARVF